MDRHCQNAQTIAERLAAHPMVEHVSYPGLVGDRYYDRAQTYFQKRGAAPSSPLPFGEGLPPAESLSIPLNLFSLLANVADAKSLVIHPASTTHGQMSEQALREAGIEPGMIRLSIGLEDVEDIWEDLAAGLAAGPGGINLW